MRVEEIVVRVKDEDGSIWFYVYTQEQWNELRKVSRVSYNGSTQERHS
jgi:hypothetical protein